MPVIKYLSAVTCFMSKLKIFTFFSFPSLQTTYIYSIIFKYTFKILCKYINFILKIKIEILCYILPFCYFHSTENIEHFLLTAVLSCLIIFNGFSMSLCGDIIISLICSDHLFYSHFIIVRALLGLTLWSTFVFPLHSYKWNAMCRLTQIKIIIGFAKLPSK